MQVVRSVSPFGVERTSTVEHDCDLKRECVVYLLERRPGSCRTSCDDGARSFPSSCTNKGVEKVRYSTVDDLLASTVDCSELCANAVNLHRTKVRGSVFRCFLSFDFTNHTKKMVLRLHDSR
jgi:hypothetical protein